MTGNRTTELRRLFDEYGIEYREHGGVSTGAMESYTRFVIDGDDGMVKAILETSEHSKAVLLTLRCTPEQAIAAKLGADANTCWYERTCKNVSSTNYFHCSECDKRTYKGEEEFNYCPNCGAKVVGE